MADNFDYTILSEMASIGTSDSTTTMYTNPSSTTSFVRKIWLHVGVLGLTNFSATTVTLYNVPDTGGVAGVGENPTSQFYEKVIATSETITIDCGTPGLIMADENDTLQIMHTSQTTVSYMVYGGTET